MDGWIDGWVGGRVDGWQWWESSGEILEKTKDVIFSQK